MSDGTNKYSALEENLTTSKGCKYVKGSTYQKAVDALKYIYDGLIRRSDPYFAFPQINDICKDTLKDLGEIE